MRNVMRLKLCGGPYILETSPHRPYIRVHMGANQKPKTHRSDNHRSLLLSNAHCPHFTWRLFTISSHLHFSFNPPFFSLFLFLVLVFSLFLLFLFPNLSLDLFFSPALLPPLASTLRATLNFNSTSLCNFWHVFVVKILEMDVDS